MGPLDELVTRYLDRVVNRRDLSGVDDLVDAAYRGSGDGWPATITALRAFYEEQARRRPDWRIDVRQTVELHDTVVVRAHAHGTSLDGDGRTTPLAFDWLARYRLHDGKIVEIDVLALLPAAVAPGEPR